MPDRIEVLLLQLNHRRYFNLICLYLYLKSKIYCRLIKITVIIKGNTFIISVFYTTITSICFKASSAFFEASSASLPVAMMWPTRSELFSGFLILSPGFI